MLVDVYMHKVESVEGELAEERTTGEFSPEARDNFDTHVTMVGRVPNRSEPLVNRAPMAQGYGRSEPRAR